MILVLETTNCPAARHDAEILSRRGPVRRFRIVTSPRMALLVNQVHLALWLLRHVWGAKGVFVRFADWYLIMPAFLARLNLLRLWIVIGGFDAHHLPDHHYGVYDSPLRAWIVRFVVRSATHLFPVHASLTEGLVRNVPRLSRRTIRVIHDGFDPAEWYWETGIHKTRSVMSVISVSGVSAKARVKRMEIKGVRILWEIARRMEDVEFVIAGMGIADLDLLGLPALPNLRLVGKLDARTLRSYYAGASVYIQPSLTEGLPAAVAEAMLCECVSVVSAVGGMPDMVGDAGVVIEGVDSTKWVDAIRWALDKGCGKKARERIIALYPVEERRDSLLREVRP